MLELLILGIVLFIVGVSATLVYDKYKDKIQVELQHRRELHQHKADAVERARKDAEYQVQKAKEEIQKLKEEIRAKSYAKIKLPKSKPVAQEIHYNSFPTETETVEYTINDLKKLLEAKDDVTVKNGYKTMTLEEFLAKWSK